MTIGIIGLGLIGGSMAKAFRRDPESVILGMDTDERTVEAALLSRDMNGRLTEDKYGLCGLILLAAYPQGTEEWLRENAARIPAHVLVVDCLGVKGKICRTGFELAEQYGFTFVGGHPMAGTQYSGFRYAKEDMFDGSTMVLVPPAEADAALIERVKGCFAPARFWPTWSPALISKARRRMNRKAFPQEATGISPGWRGSARNCGRSFSWRTETV